MSRRKVSEPPTPTPTPERSCYKLSDVLAVGNQHLNRPPFPIDVRGESMQPYRQKAVELFGNRAPGEDDPRMPLEAVRHRATRGDHDGLTVAERQGREAWEALMQKMVDNIFSGSVQNVEQMFKEGFDPTLYGYSSTLMTEEGWVYFILSKTIAGGTYLGGKGHVYDFGRRTHPRVADEFETGAYPDYILPMVKLFIDAGSPVDIQTADFGDSVLHCAARHDFTGELTALLLNAGANVSLVNYRDERAQDLARILGNTLVEQLLSKHNAEELVKTMRQGAGPLARRDQAALYWQEETAKKKYHPDQIPFQEHMDTM